MIIGKLNGVNYSQNQLQRILETSIDQLSVPTGYNVNTIEDFFTVYEIIKGQIDALGDQYSHQYLFNQAISLTNGQIMIPDSGEETSYYNLFMSPSGITQQNMLLNNQVESLTNQIEQLNVEIETLQDTITAMQREINNKDYTISSLQQSIETLRRV
jgi:uncharacterized protein (UPF0335 family)